MNPPAVIAANGRRTGHLLLVAGALLVAALLVACSSDSESTPSTPVPPVSTSPPAVATAGPPAPTVLPTAQPGLQTGVPTVDKAMTATRDKDVSALAAQVDWQRLACTSAQGLGGPPKCRPGEAPGTVVEVVFSSSCDGSYLRRDEVAPLVSRFVDGGGRLAGVYRHNGVIFPSSQYVIVYSFDSTTGNQARALFVSDSGIVGFTFACGLNVKQYLETNSLTDAIFLAGG